ncbi:MAG: hypothetical protein JW704_10275 [Anaerolineaceae bacterium]|nr:hypothetical protein [Anaerolineaceae bacterium]
MNRSILTILELAVLFYLFMTGYCLDWLSLKIPKNWALFQVNGLAFSYLILLCTRLYIRRLYRGNIPRVLYLLSGLILIGNLSLPLYSWLIHKGFVLAQFHAFLFILCEATTIWEIYLLLRYRPDSSSSDQYVIRQVHPVFISLFLCYLSLSPFVLYDHVSTGDEPHYLLMTHSLLHDFDLNLHNNYQNRDYTYFCTGELSPQPTDFISDTVVHSYHSPILSFLILPGYALAGRLGAIVLMNFLGALLFSLVYRYLCRFFSSGLSLSVTFCCAFMLPFSQYSYAIFPEIPGALIVFYLFSEIGRDLPRKRIVPLLVGLLFLLCMLKLRYLPLALFLLVFYCIRSKSYKMKASFSIMGLSLIALFLISFYQLSQTGPLFLSRYGHFFRSFFSFFWECNIAHLSSGFGLLFDQEYGLLFHAPIYLLAVLTVLLNRLTRRYAAQLCPEFWWGFVLSLSYYLVLIKTKGLIWHGGWAPPLRFLCIILPLLVPTLAVISLIRNVFFHVLRFLAVSFGFFVSALCLAVPHIVYNQLDGSNQWLGFLGRHLQRNLFFWFPSFVRPNPAIYPFFMALFLFFLYLIITGFVLKQDEAVTRSISPASILIGLKKGSVMISWLAVVLVMLFGLVFLQPYLPRFQLEAEDKSDFHRTSGQIYPLASRPEHKRSALYTQGWELLSNGSITGFFRTITDTFTVRIWAKGMISNGQWPLMKVDLNRETLGTTMVISNISMPDQPPTPSIDFDLRRNQLASETMYWMYFDFNATAPIGEQVLAIHFINDHRDLATGHDRNLIIDRVDIIPSCLSSWATRKGVLIWPWFPHFSFR